MLKFIQAGDIKAAGSTDFIDYKIQMLCIRRMDCQKRQEEGVKPKIYIRELNPSD